jgi:hypothetical protein
VVAVDSYDSVTDRNSNNSYNKKILGGSPIVLPLLLLRHRHQHSPPRPGAAVVLLVVFWPMENS